MLFHIDQFDEAVAAAHTSLEKADKAGFGDKPFVLAPLQVLGSIYLGRKDLPKAADVYEKLYAVLEPRKLVVPSKYAYVAVMLGDICRREDKLADAERYYRLGIESARNNHRQEDIFFAKALYGLGLILSKENNYKEAEECFHEALPLASSWGNEARFMAP